MVASFPVYDHQSYILLFNYEHVQCTIFWVGNLIPFIKFLFHSVFPVGVFQSSRKPAKQPLHRCVVSRPFARAPHVRNLRLHQRQLRRRLHAQSRLHINTRCGQLQSLQCNLSVFFCVYVCFCCRTQVPSRARSLISGGWCGNSWCCWSS